MTVDSRRLAENLRLFYNFTDKVVLFVGAGTGQLLDPSLKAKKLIAIDRDVEALQALQSRMGRECGKDSVEVLPASFEDVILFGDVVYFEFCLHEMDEPRRALIHARTLAPDIVVFDHSPGSDWAFYTGEEGKVRRSAEAVKRLGVRRFKTIRTEQRFNDYPELLAKVSTQGAVAIQRVQHFISAANIVIPMNCQLTLL